MRSTCEKLVAPRFGDMLILGTHDFGRFYESRSLLAYSTSGRVRGTRTTTCRRAG